MMIDVTLGLIKNHWLSIYLGGTIQIVICQQNGDLQQRCHARQGHQLPRRRADQALQTTGGGGEGTLPIAAAKHVYLGPEIGEL
jgi:hypothetical protein